MYSEREVNAAIIFEYEDDWKEKCRLENISNPYDKIEANKKRKYKYTSDIIQGGFLEGLSCTRVIIDDSIDEIDGVSKEEIVDYDAAKALFMCGRILEDFGWEALANNYTYGKYAGRYLPCSGGDRQCSMFCPNFGRDCAALWRQDYEDDF